MSETNGPRIVVGVDFDETGDNALREAIRVARGLDGSELHVVNVLKVDKDVHNAKKLEELSNELRASLDQLRGHVMNVCRPAAGEEAFHQETVFHVRLGAPAEAIHQVAVDVDADSIVVGTHSRKGVSKWVLGSVAEELIRKSHCPVTVAHPKDFSGLDKSAQPDARRPGEDLSSHGLSDRLRLEFMPRSSHISGLI